MPFHRPAFTFCFVCVVSTMTAACSVSSDEATTTVPPQMPEFTDFATLERPGSPNSWLIAPAGPSATSPRADARAPEFNISAKRLSEDWAAFIGQQPRTRILGISDDGLQVEAEQRSTVFGFVDKVSFRAVQLGGAQSTFYAYSRSQTGYWDLGVNRKRLQDWVAALQP